MPALRGHASRAKNRLAFSSSLAIATALAAGSQAASAQSFQGSSTVVAGNATVTTGANTTTVDVASPQAVINWMPFDTANNPGVPINFQPAGTTATFQSTGQFAVLNRILPSDASRPVTFNGTVISQLQGASVTPGGTVYFYSPAGVIVGASAVFNVGNLGLTTSDPLVSGGEFIDASGKVNFTGAAPGSFVEVRPGAQINALNNGSYVAAFAPSVYQNGTVTVNGQAAYVAGEAGTITFNPNGLFDIQVTTGTDGLNGGPSNVAIEHTGTTTGGASTGAGDNRRIYMIAVPKNNLITLSIARGSSLGFDIAGAADVVGNTVVLSAGYNVTGGAIEAAPAGGGGKADLTLSDYNGPNQPSGLTVTSALIGQASRNARLDVLANTNLASDVRLSAVEDSAAVVSIATSQTSGLLTTGHLTVGGDLTLSAERQVAAPSLATDAGDARMIVFGGATADITGDLSLLANAYAFSTADGATTGGNANLSVDSDPALSPAISSLNVGGNLLVRAQGITDLAPSPMTATGGAAAIIIQGASDATVAGVTRVRAEGVSNGAVANGGLSALNVLEGSSFTTGELNVSADGSAEPPAPTAAPGLVTGGQASIQVDGAGSVLTVNLGNSSGDENFGDFELLSAEAFGGVSNAVGGAGGAAQGGTALFLVTNGATANLPVDPGAAGYIRMFARGRGGNTVVTGGTGGAATGGTVELTVNGGTLNTGNTLLPSSYAQGGNVAPSVTGAANGGNAVGGTRIVNVVNGTINGSFSGGGPGAVGGNGSALGTGGNGIGGTATFFMDNGTITATTDAFGISRVTSFTQNAGGTGAIGGSATGGLSNVTIQNNSVITANPDSNGIGGLVTFSASNTTPDLITDGAVASGDATGGTVNVTVSNSQINAAEFDVVAEAFAGAIATPTGAGAGAHTGNGTGGTATLNLNGATINAGLVTVGADGNAGDADDVRTVNAGNGVGGTAFLFARGAPSSITTDLLQVTASGTGGTVFSGPGNGGNATGGRALVNANSGGRLTVAGTTSVEAGADGHSAQVQGRGGDAASGFAEASAAGGGSLTFNGDVSITAIAESGDGLVTGTAQARQQNSTQGGLLPNALLYAQNGSITVTGTTSLAADSYGGVGFDGGKGGTGIGGLAVVNSDNSLAGGSSISLQNLAVSAAGYGGDADIALAGGAGGAGGDARGGEVDAIAGAGNGALTVAGQTTLIATALGGTGGEGGGGTAGGTGGAGGSAVGGTAIFGTLSRADTGSINTGSATFADVLAFADADGGTGGIGGTGSSSTGNGGAGGSASGGAALLLVRGSRVTVTGGADLVANAVGGDGGTGAVQGAGGAATVGGDGGVAVQVFARANQPTQRGFLDAQDIFGSAQAFGGAGSLIGAATVADSPISVDIANGDASLASLSFSAAGTPVAGVRPSYLSVVNGTFDVDSLAMSTPGEMYVLLDNSAVNVGNLSLSAANFVLPATRPATFGTFNVTGQLLLESDLNFLAYANFVLSGGATFDSDGSILTGDITANGTIDLSAVGTITTGAIDATSAILRGTQGVTTAAITADNAIIVTSSGPVALGALTAGGTTPGLGKVAIGSASGPVTTGAIRSTGDLGIQTGGSISTGDLIGRDVLLLAGQNIATGSILAASGTQATGAIYFGNSSMASSAANVFQPFRGQTGMLSIFQAIPVAIGGSASFGGPIQAGALTGAAQGSISALGVNAANFISLTAGGLASVGGAWRSPDIEIVSGDIAIAQAGSLDALSINGEISLASTNAAGMTVGDRTGSTGYVLDNAEFGRIKAGQINIVGSDTSQPTDMTIGDLSITGSQLYGDGGTVLFATGDRQTETPGGILRIAGAVNATGFAAANEIDLLSGTVELEATAGSLRVTDGSNNLGGLVYIEADHIHVASDAILTKLRADPLYDGHIAELNAAPVIARPEGVLSASGLELHPGQTLYVQNTGTRTLPAGFLSSFDNTEVVAPDQPPTGGVEVVVNGQFRDGATTVTGRDAYNLVISDAAGDSTAFAGFSGTSQLNGCLFTGGCSSSQANDAVASVASEIAIVTSGTLDDSPTAPAADDSDEGDDGSSDKKDEDDAADSGSSPIAPPTPLINTRPLTPNADVEEPVSGAGNPALLGSAVDEGAPPSGNEGEKK